MDADLLTLNTIERLARALFAQLSPLTGERAGGVVRVTLEPGAVVPPNAYLVPVVGGAVRDDLVFKTLPAPLSNDGEWSAPGDSGGELGVSITSNVGGARHNIDAGTVFRFDPPLPGAVAGELVEPTAGGSDEGALVRRVAFFEDLDAANPGKDIFAAMLGALPALMLVWLDSSPAEGVTAGLRQGSTRGGRRVRFTRERFSLYVLTGRLASDATRRQEGLVILQAATRLLTDRMQNLDGEQLSSIGAGVEMNERTRVRRGDRHYIYAARLRVNQTLSPLDERTFARWLRTALAGALPGRAAPEPEDPLTLVDVLEPMP